MQLNLKKNKKHLYYRLASPKKGTYQLACKRLEAK
jgi:hypothetical protein